MDQQHEMLVGWTQGDREMLVKLGTTAGTVGFVQRLVYSDPSSLANQQRFAEVEAMQWDNALTQLRV
jgi:hypothetical protein